MAATKFEEMIVNPGIFRIILDEFLHDQPSSSDIMPVESPEDRLFKDHARMAKFCQRLRSKEDGLRRCMDCDIEFAEKAKIAGKPLHYMCHAGLMDIAVPVIVGSELVATIFCGQSRSKDQAFEGEGVRRASALEAKLGFESDELLKLREEASLLSYEQIEEIENKLWEVSTYVSSLGSSRMEAERARMDLSYRLNETEAIQKLLFELSDVLDNIESFWKRLDIVLEKICGIIGASLGVFVDFEKQLLSESNSGTIRSVAGLPNHFKGQHLQCETFMGEALMRMTPAVRDFSKEHCTNSLFIQAKQYLADPDASFKEAIVPVKLEPDREGAIIFIISTLKDTAKGLKINDELFLLTQAATHISTAYGNCLLYHKQKELVEIQSAWLENVSHQIVAPLNGILGHVENLSKNFRTWQKTNPQRIENTFVTLTELTEWANRMAKNFAWVANDHNHPVELDLRLEDDVPGKLIGYARNVQGLARNHGVKTVHVESELVEALNGRIAIDNKLFKQAVANLLDNAIKYAAPRTDVLVNARLTATEGKINVINYGIPIQESEAELIFTRYFRTEEAKKKYSVGSGIGLGIAREIIRLHGGDLTVFPSVRSVYGWKTVFVITLPLLKES